MRAPTNGSSSTSPAPVALADVSPDEIQVVERTSWWAWLRAVVERLKVANLLACALGGAVVYLVVLGYRARGVADAVALKADVSAAVERHAAKPDPGHADLERKIEALDAKLERKSAVLEGKLDLLITRIAPAAPAERTAP